ncbi:hypothetical protein C4561_04285 [candidate division WWE3 bacterium]|jgi:tRNA A37 threonylcarbamoyladenosine modification protein TsaB|uniref:Gcp-like domain-containing protein n=1 Tax=candidate division WWE3 bacterium TaxID=2053526 RepID=A0A3A4ZCJ1_UNCKA|nr:MAG: hypothetical protein C4561_04285 [candidate division WWE3 bacterium]
MYKILIDSRERKTKIVALLRVSDDREVTMDSLTGDIDIVASIGKLLEKNKLKPENVSEVYSNPGPGSFTGLKLGATIANVFNWAVKDIPISELKYPEYGGEPNIQIPPKKG